HVVVKQRRPIDPYGDDAHWPLDVAFIVLGSFLLGAALAQQSFGATHFLRSAWSSIVGVPLLVAATIIGSRLIHRRWLRRSMQLALLASLLLHLGLMLGVTLVEMPARSSARLPTRPQVIRERSP